MSARKALIGFGISIGCAAGSGFAMSEVNHLNGEAEKIELCLANQEARGEPRPESVCGNTAAEAEGLRDRADSVGSLGWVAALGLLIAAPESYHQALKAGVIKQPQDDLPRL